MLDKALIKLDKRKQILDQQENDIKSLKDERFRLEEKVRMLMRENNDERGRFNREREDKMRIQTEIHDLSNRINDLLKDNQTLEANLEEFKKRPSTSDSTCTNSETDLKLKINLLEKERDAYKWAQERTDLEKKINEYKELLKSKDTEYQIKENREIQKYKDELFSVEEDYKEQVNKLQKECYEKEKSLTSLREKYHLIETQNHNIN